MEGPRSYIRPQVLSAFASQQPGAIQCLTETKRIAWPVELVDASNGGADRQARSPHLSELDSGQVSGSILLAILGFRGREKLFSDLILLTLMALFFHCASSLYTSLTVENTNA